MRSVVVAPFGKKALSTMATEAYVKQHKLEKTLEDMLNSLKSQPDNPYSAMVRLLPPATCCSARDHARRSRTEPAHPWRAALHGWLAPWAPPPLRVHGHACACVSIGQSLTVSTSMPPLLPTAQAKYLATAKLGDAAASDPGGATAGSIVAHNNIEQWHKDNIDLFAPPICNKIMHKDDMTVMCARASRSVHPRTQQAARLAVWRLCPASCRLCVHVRCVSTR